MSLDALEVSLDVIRTLRAPLAAIRVCDPKLYDQIRRAVSSVALNIAEGQGRLGRDRRHFWRIAAGSANEVRTALRVAMAWGDLTPESVEPTLTLLDRVAAMLWRMTR